MKYVSGFLAVILVSLLLVPVNTFAQNQNSIERIISGKQDFLVFGSVDSVNSNGICTVEISEEIGVNEDASDDELNDEESLTGRTIEVSNFTSYMYFDNYVRSPKKGDNILLSLRFRGNVYDVENGAFLVDYANYETFNLIAQDDLSDSSKAELTALYMYVRSNGRNADYIIGDGAVYTHDNGKEKSVPVPQGILFVDESGNITKNSHDVKNDDDGILPDENRWIVGFVILVIGAVAGAFITKLYMRMEKKADRQ
ncbi:MAG: hypothetical protein II998_08820 [Clostridia bacterium]|nr:hypothetical protein [Clostridia bacterium]